jgi:hypothetical protein
MPTRRRTPTVTTATVIAGDSGEPTVPTVDVIDEVVEMGKKTRGRTATLAITNKTTTIIAIAFALGLANATTLPGVQDKPHHFANETEPSRESKDRGMSLNRAIPDKA